MLIRNHSLDEANRAVFALLDQRIAAGDVELRAVGLLLQHYQIILADQEPLAHIRMVPLRPSGELYACFDQFIDLLHQQHQQIAELQSIISELI